MKITDHKDGDRSFRFEGRERYHSSFERIQALWKMSGCDGGPYSWFADMVQVMKLEGVDKSIGGNNTGTDAAVIVTAAVVNHLANGSSSVMDKMEFMRVFDPDGTFAKRYLETLEQPADPIEMQRWARCEDCGKIFYRGSDQITKCHPPCK